MTSDYCSCQARLDCRFRTYLAHHELGSDSLRSLQVQELAQLQQQLYEELSRTPEQGAAFTDVVKTVLERETAFVKWKSEGASPYWDATGSGPDNTASCEPHYGHLISLH